MYHSIGRPEAGDRMGLKVSLGNFERQVDWLIHQDWEILTVGELIRSKLSEKNQAAISFDDGYRDQLSAANSLHKRGLQGTFFIIPGRAGQTMGGRAYYSQWKLMGLADLKLLIKYGHEIGGHSYSHPGPLTLQAKSMIKKEIENCHQWIQSFNSGQEIGFSYPHGASSSEVEASVQKAGFKYACDSRPGAITGKPRPFQLPRIEISGFDSLEKVINKIQGNGEVWRRLYYELTKNVWKVQGKI